MVISIREAWGGLVHEVAHLVVSNP